MNPLALSTSSTTAPALAERLSQDATGAVVRMITEFALDPWTLFIAGVVFLILRYATRILHAGENDRLTSIVRRLLPMLPEAIGVAIAVLGGVPDVAQKPLIIRVAVGLWAAYVASKIHKVLGQTVLGDDTRLERAVARRLSQRGDGDVGDDGQGQGDDDRGAA